MQDVKGIGWGIHYRRAVGAVLRCCCRVEPAERVASTCRWDMAALPASLLSSCS